MEYLYSSRVKNSFFTCLMFEPFKIRVIFGKNSERTSTFVGNLSSILMGENIFSRCLSFRYDGSNKQTSFSNSHDAAHDWISENLNVQCLSDSKEHERCLVVVHNVDGIEQHVDLKDFLPVVESFQSINRCLFLMTTTKKETYDALLKSCDSLTDEQLTKPFIYRV